jgi:hypothetical protein
MESFLIQAAAVVACWGGLALAAVIRETRG